jgi:hypothetical protein
MKNRLLTTSLLLLAAMGMLFASCKKEYPQPPIQNLPEGTVYTIGEIIDMEPGTVFNEDASVYGIVTADEQSGNLYKAAYIQDRASGAAIQLYLNAVSGVRIGDSIRVYLKDVTFDMYHGLPQLSNFGPDGHIIILANNRPITPASTTLSDVLAGQYLAGLVRLEGVSFVEQEGTFAPSTGYGEHYIQDAFGNTAMVRTSNYANFAANPLPKGTGNLVAIASLYNTTWQLTLRSYYELEFDGIDPGGSSTPGDEQNLPYTQLFSTAFGTYMTYSVMGDDQFWKIDYSSAVMTGHEKVGEQHFYYENEDWLISSPVRLVDVDHAKAIVSYAAQYVAPFNNDVTMQVSNDYVYGTDPTEATWTELPVTYPNSNQWNFQEKEASLDAFLGQTVTVAIKFVSSASASRTFEVQSISIVEGEAGDVPMPPTPGEGEGSGTADDPYNVAAGISQQSNEPTVWVQGFIVGAVKTGVSAVNNNDEVNWGAPFDLATNVVIADDANCNEITQCIIVNLPAGKPLRTQVNLVDNPGNLGKRLAVYGKLRTYFGQAGLRDSAGTEADFVLEGGDTPTPPTPPTPGETIFSETFANGQGDFTIQDLELAGLSYVWNYMTSYHCMKANGYYQGAHATESWLVSPQIDLTNVSNATLKFDHAVAFASAEGSFFVMVSTNYAGDVTTATWTELNIGSWPEPNSSWVFEGASADMSSFVGQNVTIAFKYTSTTDVCPAWEVKNVVVE